MCINMHTYTYQNNKKIKNRVLKGICVCELYVYVCEIYMHVWCIWSMCIIYFCGAYVYVHVWYACVSLCVCGAHEYVYGICML